jgi:hypothetical protein
MGKNGRIPVSTVAINSLPALPKAMDHLCSETAAQVENNAKHLIENAHEVAAKLNELALAIREHGKLAEGRVTKFCADAKHILETSARLQAMLSGEPEGETIESTRLPEAPQLDVDHHE